MLAIGAVQLALFVCYIGIGALLLPLQIGRLAPANKIVDLSLFTGTSVLIALVSNPIVGAFSDRTTSRFGRRRPWILVGGIFTAASLFIMVQASTIPLLFLGWCGIQLFSNFTLAAVTATIPDRVPENQRGMVSAIYGLGVPLGGIIGSLLVGQVFKTPAGSYTLMLVLVLLTTIPLGLFMPDKVLPKGYLPPFRFGAFLKNFWIDPVNILISPGPGLPVSSRLSDILWALVTCSITCKTP
jgi:MFS family permease